MISATVAALAAKPVQAATIANKGTTKKIVAQRNMIHLLGFPVFPASPAALRGYGHVWADYEQIPYQQALAPAKA